MAANCYKCGELFLRFHHQNVDGIDGAGGNLSVELDSQANQRNQTEVLPVTTTLKRKAASSQQTTNEHTSEQNLQRGQTENRRKSGQGLLNNKEYKVTCDRAICILDLTLRPGGCM